jgi:hypothetical protein
MGRDARCDFTLPTTCQLLGEQARLPQNNFVTCRSEKQFKKKCGFDGVAFFEFLTKPVLRFFEVLKLSKKWVQKGA